MDYDKKYDIRLANIDDIPSIMRFIDEYWRKDHILARDRNLFQYEHVIGGRVTFVLAIEKESAEIAGLLGYIPASSDMSQLDVWTGIWKVKDKVMPLLGMELYKRLQSMIGARSLLGVGDSQVSTGRLLRKLTKTFNTWRMDHFYYLAEREHYYIAEVNRPIMHSADDYYNPTSVVLLDSIEKVRKHIDLQLVSSYPYKDYWYIKHRYFDHPIYKYEVYGLRHDRKNALMIIRLQRCVESNVARIVDYIGDQECFCGITSFIDKYLKTNNCEYADFYVHGFNNSYISRAGFMERKEDDENIIPNYFYPLVKENIDIWVSGNIEDGLFCKADGDQDRPN